MATRPVKLPTKALDGPAQQLAFCAPSLSQVGRHQQLAMPRDWMRKWRKFAHQSSPEIPPMINATPLIGKVPTGLIAYSQVASRSGSDYKFIDHVIWKYLVDQFGFQGPKYYQTHHKGAHCNIQDMAIAPLTDSTHDFNLSLLIDYPHLKFDLDLTHTLSGTTWNLPSAVLGPHGIMAPALATLVKNSTFPKSSIDALIRYLCLQGTEDLSCVDFSHIVRMFSQLRLDMDRPLNDLKLVLENMPHDVALQGIIDVWEDKHADWKLNDTIMHLMAAKVRKGPIGDETFINLLYPSMNDPTLCFLLFSPIQLKSPQAASWTWNPMAPREHSSQSAANPQDILKSPSDFLFVLEVADGHVAAISDSLILLLPQWLWIRRMFSSGCSESKTRVAHMPHWMTRKVLLAILYSIRGQSVTNLTRKGALTILEYASELNLRSVENDPLEPFTRLLSNAHALCFPKLTVRNCFGQLNTAHRLKMQSETEEIITYMVQKLPHLEPSSLLTPELAALFSGKFPSNTQQKT